MLELSDIQLINIIILNLSENLIVKDITIDLCKIPFVEDDTQNLSDIFLLAEDVNLNLACDLSGDLITITNDFVDLSTVLPVKRAPENSPPSVISLAGFLQAVASKTPRSFHSRGVLFLAARGDHINPLIPTVICIDLREPTRACRLS